MTRQIGIANAVILGMCLLCHGVQAEITVTTDHGPNPNFDHTLFDSMISSDDLIQGMIATELDGDNGWHPANTNPADQLSAFTDGLGGVRDLTGLLNDFPGEGKPTKLIQYDLAEPSNIGQINILTGNRKDVDGRAFCTVRILYSTDNGSSFLPLGGYVPSLGANTNGYYQADPPLTINEPGGSFNGNLETLVTFMNITNDASPLLATGVTNLQFDFYSTNNTVNWYWDAFDGVNPFTGYDDGQTEAISSPLVWEIDVIEGPEVTTSADFDSDGDVDGVDYLIWQSGFGIDDGTAQLGDGDANGDGNVNDADLSIWQDAFGPPAAAAAVPEPSTLSIAGIALWLTWGFRRRG